MPPSDSGPLTRWLDHPAIARVVDRSTVVTIRRTIGIYGSSAGGLLASGLAYSGLFTVFSASLFLIGILGFLVREPGREAVIVGEIARRLPPIAAVLQIALARVADAAVQFSLAGLAGLAWSAGRFYDNLDIAFARIFEDEPARSLGVRVARGIVVVIGLTAIVVVSIVLASLAASFEGSLTADSTAIRLLVTAIATIAGLAVYVVSVGAIYRFVPPRQPSWRSIRRPAIVVAVLLSAFTSLFVQVQSRLLGSLELLTEFVGVLAAMIWLSIGFQILLIGCSWVRVREEGPEGARPGPDG